MGMKRQRGHWETKRTAKANKNALTLTRVKTPVSAVSYPHYADKIIVWRCGNVQMLLDEQQDVQVSRKYSLNFRVAAAQSARIVTWQVCPTRL